MRAQNVFNDRHYSPVIFTLVGKQALIWAERVNKRPKLTAPSEAIPAKKLGRVAAYAGGRGRSGLRKRPVDLIATELLAAAAAGHALLEVARPEASGVECYKMQLSFNHNACINGAKKNCGFFQRNIDSIKPLMPSTSSSVWRRNVI